MVWTDWLGKIIKVECGFQGNENDRGMYKGSQFYRFNSLFLRFAETVGGDAIFRGSKGSGSRGEPGEKDCFAPFNETELRERPFRRPFNRLSHRYRVVVENSIGAIKKWLIVKHPYRGNKEDQVHSISRSLQYTGPTKCLHKQAFLWLTASRLTAYIMRVRNKYPRGDNFRAQQLEEWEAELDEFLWIDALFPSLY